jgi:hypothetical protein
MRIIATRVTLSVALLCVLPTVSRPEANRQPDAQRISRLINQLGSKKFQEREQAANELDAAGATVLAALQRAGHHPDPEVSRRAESLAQRIEKRLETAQLLQPKHVRLRLRDTPLDEAIADLARQTGFALEAPVGAHNQRITLDTGETTFWQALDQFCRKAGLVEQPPSPAAQTASPEFRVMNGRNGIIVNNVIISSSGRQAGYGANGDGALRLASGKAPSGPTCYAGAVRIRALTGERNPRIPGLRSGEAGFWLEVMPQPKMGWQAVLDVQVEKAIDEHGQPLLPSADAKEASPEIMMRGGRPIILNAETGQTVDVRTFPVRLKLGDRPSRNLKELSATISAQVQTAMEPLVTVDDVLKSAGKTVKGKDGHSVTITEIARDSEGVVKMRIALEEPVPANLAFNRRIFRANRVVVRNGVVVNGGIMRETGVAGESKLALLDAQGKGFSMEVNSYGMSLKGANMVQDMHITFQPHGGQGEPARFVYSDHRLVNIDIPFVLKDVALSAK